MLTKKTTEDRGTSENNTLNSTASKVDEEMLKLSRKGSILDPLSALLRKSVKKKRKKA